MLFGKNKEKGLHFNGRQLDVVTLGENGITLDDIMVHDETTEDTGIHMMLAHMGPAAGLPVALGVIRNVKKVSYTQLYEEQMEEQMNVGKYKCMDDLLNSGDTWEV
jgi:2-oxoglutarate ferredoxin oxidoreductase subunit beta